MKSFLAGGIPDLRDRSVASPRACRIVLGKLYLHRHEPIVDKDFFGEKVGSNSCLVASAEFLVDLLPQDDGPSVISK